MKVVLMAGGKGTRISSIASDIPKPMINIGGKPVLEIEIEYLRDQGFKDIIITVSHLGQKIIDYFGDGSKFGVSIAYFYEDTPLGNAGALLKIKEELTDTFLLINADVLFSVDFKKMIQFHNEKGGLATIFTHPNSHPYDSGLIIVNDDGLVTKWLSKEEDRPQWYKNRVNAGIHILNKKVLNSINELSFPNGKIDLDRDILRPLQGTGKLFAYDSPEYVKDMGTPERYATVTNDYKKGLVSKKNLGVKQKAIFLDRDGVINRYVGFLTNIDDFELVEGIEEAIHKINLSGYLAIVVTNQPVIARGEVTFNQLETIHNKMETLLGKKGAYLDAIYFCPHHPHGGYEGEVKELKMECACRKPKPGMLLKAAEEYNIDLSQSWMIGDEESDVAAGKAAGCNTIKIEKDHDIRDIISDIVGAY